MGRLAKMCHYFTFVVVQHVVHEHGYICLDMSEFIQLSSIHANLTETVLVT